MADSDEVESIGEVFADLHADTVKVTCPECEKEHEVADVYAGAPVKWGHTPRYSVCPECRKAAADRHKAEAEEYRQDELKAYWESICPPLYRKTDPTWLQDVPLANVLGWQYGPKGLFLLGPTNTGKTRAMFLLMHRLVFKGRTVRVFDCAAFGHECQRRFMAGTGPDWIDALARVEVVFFDDFGKMPLTERVEAELFAVIERRAANELPTFATSNMTGADLEHKASADRGAPLVRRLREFCRVVVFAN